MPLETTYTITSKKVGVITFKFNLNGDLILFKYEGVLLNDEQKEWLYSRIIKSEKHIDYWMKKKGFTVTKGQPNISFEAFWDAYNKKQKITRSKKLYKALSSVDRFNAIAGIRRYDNWLRTQNGIAKMLPDTYLHQKRWLDEF